MTPDERPFPGVVITDRTAAHVLWHFGDPAGMVPSSLTMHLLRALAVADPENRGRLYLGFPELVACFELAEVEGPQALRVIVDEAQQDTDPEAGR